jgi:8-oxo-dGTP pyrophosphatase MutT (NUDIX family)
MGIVLTKTVPSQVLVIENDGEIVFPKGHVEPDEARAATAIREVKEETGVDLSFTNYLGKIDQFEFYFEGEKAIKVIEVHLFIVDQVQSTTPNLLEGISKAYWMDAVQAMEKLSHNDARAALSKSIARMAAAS